MTTLNKQTLNKQELLNDRAIRTWLLGLTLAGGILLGVAATIAIQAGLPNPGSAHSALGLTISDMDEARISQAHEATGELAAARRRLRLSQEALLRVPNDRRWAEPDQQEHLQRVMRDTSHDIQRYRARVEELENEISEL